MNAKSITLIASLFTGQAMADVYKCGDTYQQVPCASDNKVFLRSPASQPSIHNRNNNLPSDELNLRPSELELLNKIKFREEAKKGNVIAGMSEENVLAAWGKPTRIHQKTSRYGKTDQWVYEKTNPIGQVIDTRYVYFDNGVVTNIQIDKSSEPE